MQGKEMEVTMPVTVQQIAAAIHRMSEAELNELLRLVPELAAAEDVKASETKHLSYNFGHARQLLREVKGDLSDTVSEERDERG